MPQTSKKRAPAAPTKRTGQAAERRVAIVNAAIDEFTDKGFKAARMEDIARRAGVAKGTIYLQFKDKDALFEAIVRQEISPLVDSVTAKIDPGESVRAFLDRVALPTLQALQHSRRGAVVRLLIGEASRFPKLAERYYQIVIEPGLALFGKLARRAAESGELRSTAFVRFPQLFIAPALLGLLWSGLFERFRHLDAEQMYRAYLDEIFQEQRTAK